MPDQQSQPIPSAYLQLLDPEGQVFFASHPEPFITELDVGGKTLAVTLDQSGVLCLRDMLRTANKSAGRYGSASQQLQVSGYGTVYLNNVTCYSERFTVPEDLFRNSPYCPESLNATLSATISEDAR